MPHVLRYSQRFRCFGQALYAGDVGLSSPVPEALGTARIDGESISKTCNARINSSMIYTEFYISQVSLVEISGRDIHRGSGRSVPEDRGGYQRSKIW